MIDMTPQPQAPRHYGFALGLMTGTCVGAGLMMWLAPKATTELRQRMTDSAKTFGESASARYADTSTSVGAAVSEVARRGRDVGDGVAESVARGAHEVARAAQAVERAATATTRR